MSKIMIKLTLSQASGKTDSFITYDEYHKGFGDRSFHMHCT